MDALDIIEKFFDPGEGYFTTVLYGDGGLWRLDYAHDHRIKGIYEWSFIQFEKLDKIKKRKRLEKNEIYGFLMAKFPDLNIKQLIHDEIKDRLEIMIKEIET